MQNLAKKLGILKFIIYLCAFKIIAEMAQLVEQRIRNAWVTGSSPVFGSNYACVDLGLKLATHFPLILLMK